MKRATTANNMFALWPGDELNFSIFIKPTFGFPAKRGAGSETNRGFAISATRQTLIITIVLRSNGLKPWEKERHTVI